MNRILPYFAALGFSPMAVHAAGDMPAVTSFPAAVCFIAGAVFALAVCLVCRKVEMGVVKKRADALVAENKEYFKKYQAASKLCDVIVNTLPIHIFAKNVDDDFKFVLCNDAMRKFYNLTEYDTSNFSDKDFRTPDDFSAIRREDEEFAADENTIREKLFWETADNGGKYCFKTIKRTFVDENGNKLLLGAAIDVTELQALKNELQDSATAYKLLLDNMPGYVFTLDADNNYSYTSFNKSCLKLWNKSYDEAIGKTDYDLFGAEYADKLVVLYNQAMLGDTTTEHEIEFADAFGTRRKGMLYLKQLTLSSGKKLLFGFGVDLTEQEKLKSKLKDSISIFKLLLDNMPCHIVAKDVNDNLKYTLCNRSFCRLAGLSQEEMLGRSDDDFLKKPEERTQVYEWDMEAVKGDCATEHTVKFSSPDGETHFAHTHWIPLKLSDGRHWLFMLADDITEIEKAKQLAEENAEWFRLTVSSIGDAVITTDINGNIVFMNMVAERMTACTNAEAAGKPHEEVFNIVSVGDELPMPSPITRTLRTGNTVEMANHTILISLDGSKYHVSDSAAPIKDNHDEIHGAILVFRDVTEEHENRDRLRAALTQLEYGSTLTRSASFQMDSVTHKVTGTRMLYDLMPVKNGCALRMEEWILPDDYPQACNQLRMLYTNQSSEEIFSFRSSYFGQLRYYRMVLKTERQPMRHDMILGVIQDITEIAYSTGLLKETQNLWDTVINAMPIIFFAKDAGNDFRYILCNDAFTKFVGKSKEDIIGKNDYELFAFANQDLQFMGNDCLAMESEGPKIFDEIVPNALGVSRSVQCIKMPFTYAEKRLLLGAANDVTAVTELLKRQQVMNFCLENLLSENNAQKALKNALEALSSHIGASRSVILKIDNQANANVVYCEYAAEGLDMIFRIGKAYPHDTNPSWYERFAHCEICKFPNLAIDNNGLGASWNSFIKQNNICSIYANRVMVGDKLWGIVLWLYEDTPKELSVDDCDFIGSFAHFIEFMLERKLTQMKLIESLDIEQKINEEKKLLLANEKTISYCLECLFTENNAMKAIRMVLEALRERFGASLGYIMRIDMAAKTQKVYAEIPMPGMPPLLVNYPELPFEESEEWIQLLLKHKNMLFNDLGQEVQLRSLGGWRNAAEQHNIKSLYTSGIYLHDELWGDLGFLYVDKKYDNFTAQEQILLNSMARLIEVMLVRQESYNKLILAMEDAKKADKAKSFFIASISHEIRTPLNAVIGFAELLHNSEVSPQEQKEYVEAIAYSGNALLQLINDVLDLSKLEADQMEIVTEPTNFNELANNVMQVFVHRAAERNVKLEIDIPQLPVFALDKLRIRQILFNFVGNAVKFTQNGSVKLWAQFTLDKTAQGYGQLRFGVTDTGIGIPEKDICRLQEPFVQLSKMRGTNTVNNGTGLGLPICKRLAEKMNGRVEIKSAEGNGSTFTVVLEHLQYIDQMPPDATPQVCGHGKNQSKDLAVLMVDDVLLNLKVMKAMFEKAGVCNIVTADSAAKALDALTQQDFDLVLTDMWMPEMNGKELAAKIHADARFKHLPIFAVTADVETKELTALKDFCGILYKPFSLENVYKILDSVFPNNVIE